MYRLTDLYLALRQAHYPRFEAPLVAIQSAASGSAVLLLADGYPARQTALDPVGFDLAQQKNLRVFIEYPAALPGMELAVTRTTTWERLVTLQGGHYRVPQRNEDYGTTQIPLLQQNGDPVSDQLYTTGFVLLGLHEAVGATGDPKLKRAEDELAEYLRRIQTRSNKLPYLNGTWFRAFDDQRWEAWASSADIGWGASSIESGWGQAWTAALLALREQKTTVWNFTAKSRVRDCFPRSKAQMQPDER